MIVTEQITVIILAPDELYRLAWQALLSTHLFIETVQVADSIPAVKTLARENKQTVILVDAPGSELPFIAELLSLNQKCGILLVIDDYNLHTIIQYLSAGVRGFIARNDSVSTLSQVIQKCARGEIALPSGINSPVKIMVEGERGAKSVPLDSLTEREVEVLQLLGKGLSNKGIAQRLYLSVRTVEAHLRNVYSKLDVSSRTEAALWAVRNGYAASSKKDTPFSIKSSPRTFPSQLNKNREILNTQRTHQVHSGRF